MIPYYVAYILLFLLNNIAKSLYIDKQKRYRFFCVSSFLIIGTLLALRHQTMGIDLGGGNRTESIGYLGAFDELNKYSWSRILTMKEFLNYEKGYIIFNKLVGSIYNDKQFFLAVCAFISTLPVMLYIKNKSTNPLMAVLIYLGLPVFLMSFSGLRQAIAIGITVFSVKYIEEKKLPKFILVILLATFFHRSSATFIIAYPLYHLRLSNNRKLFLILVIPVVYVLKGPLFNILSRIYKENAAIEETGAFTLLLVFFLVYVFLVFFNKDDDKEQNGMVNLFYFACICQAFGGVYQLAMRIGYYFMIHAVIAIPNTIDKMEDRRSAKLANILIFIAFVGFGVYSLRNSTWAMSYPYKFFWQE